MPNKARQSNRHERVASACFSWLFSRSCRCLLFFVVRPTASIAAMHPSPVISGPRLIGVRMPDAMRTDSFRNPNVLAVDLRPVLHVVITRTMHATRASRTLGGVVRDDFTRRSHWSPTGRTSRCCQAAGRLGSIQRLALRCLLFGLHGSFEVTAPCWQSLSFGHSAKCVMESY